MTLESSPWTVEHRARWERIAAHAIGGAKAEAAFVARLAREQAWSMKRARDAVREYRRFAFLATVSAHPVTPSHAVDAVWHLHLLFTRDYWDTFCPAALAAPLHHDPGLSAADVPRHREQYARTLASYAHWFGPVPRDFWPPPAISACSATTPSTVRGTNLLRRFARACGVALLGLPLAVQSAERPANPLDWTGTDFLLLYLCLLAAVVLGSLIWRGVMRRRADVPVRALGELTVWDLAYLAGGPLRVVDAGVTELHERGVLRWDTGQRALVNDDPSRVLEPPLDLIARHAVARGSKASGVRSIVAALGGVRHRLQQRGLWLEDAAARRIAGLSALPALLLCAFGATKIAIGLERGKPVALLVLLSLVAGAFALAMWLKRPGRTPAGDRELAKERGGAAAPGRVRRPASMAMAVALGGTAILAGTALSGYHQARAASSSGSDGSSSSDSDGGGGGDSGCGGCGGGD